MLSGARERVAYTKRADAARGRAHCFCISSSQGNSERAIRLPARSTLFATFRLVECLSACRGKEHSRSSPESSSRANWSTSSARFSRGVSSHALSRPLPRSWGTPPCRGGAGGNRVLQSRALLLLLCVA